MTVWSGEWGTGHRQPCNMTQMSLPATGDGVPDSQGHGAVPFSDRVSCSGSVKRRYIYGGPLIRWVITLRGRLSPSVMKWAPRPSAVPCCGTGRVGMHHTAATDRVRWQESAKCCQQPALAPEHRQAGFVTSRQGSLHKYEHAYKHAYMQKQNDVLRC